MDERIALAEQLRDEGFADEIVVSVQPSGGQTAEDLAICREGEAICEVPDPFTTRGEVLLMSEQREGVGRTVGDRRDVHPARRAHALHLRQVLSRASSRSSPPEQPQSHREWAHQYAYQSVAFGKALVEPCPDVASTLTSGSTEPATGCATSAEQRARPDARSRLDAASVFGGVGDDHGGGVLDGACAVEGAAGVCDAAGGLGVRGAKAFASRLVDRGRHVQFERSRGLIPFEFARRSCARR